jgi:hypothetical protein
VAAHITLDLLAKVLAEFLLAAVVFVMGFVRQYFRAHLDRINPTLRPWTLGAIVAVWAVGNALAFSQGPLAAAIVFVLSSVVLGLVVGRELGQFWAVGLHGADRQLGTGIDPVRALQLCTNELLFLGTGASKLTNHEPEFEAAIRRCQRPNRPVRMLLLSLDTGSRELERAARRAGFDRTAYRTRVVQSLRVVARMRLERALNIQVRMHSEPVPFRLMFIDSSLCLVSYNVYGEGDGSQLPQLHLVARRGQRDADTFYHPFLEYFENLWKDSIDWDFKRWL